MKVRDLVKNFPQKASDLNSLCEHFQTECEKLTSKRYEAKSFYILAANFKSCWTKCGRIKKHIYHRHSKFLDGEVKLDETRVIKQNSPGRKPFSDLSNRQKKRKLNNLVKNNDADELAAYVSQEQKEQQKRSFDF